MQYDPKLKVNAANLREDLADMEKQIGADPNDNNLINRYLAYARKLRAIEYLENGYVTARNQLPGNASLESRLLGRTR